MSHAKAIGRLSILALGLGIWAAVAAASPATADPAAPSNPLLPDLPVPLATPAQPLDLAISVSGLTLFQEGTATAQSGFGDIAIASGNDSSAFAGTGIGGPGVFDTAFALAGSTAHSGGGYFDSASADGGSEASAGGTAANLSNFDYGSAVGGANTMAESGVLHGSSALSGADFAVVYDPSSTVGSTALAGNGFFDLAAAFGDALGANAVGGLFVVDILPSL